ncbi:MAG: DUF58 domain-containing protein [Lachnospiraceae bacterium]|nr:DUF58 domain-containing protein [Lachnospiraceae bacterium]
MRKLMLIVIAAASFYIAGLYRQMPLMILAVMEWILLVFLFFVPRILRKKMRLSIPVQRSEAQKGSEKECLIRIERKGILPFHKVCVPFKVYDDGGVLVQKNKVSKTVASLTGEIELKVNCACCGILNVQISKVYLYDYLSAFSVACTSDEQMHLIVLPEPKAMQMQLLSAETMRNRQEEFAHRASVRRFGDENKEIRQIREYRVGDATRYIHWNQSAKMGTLWIKEFERDEETAFEILLDMMIPEDWKRERRDGFYEVVSALVLGILRIGYNVNVSWYEAKGSDFTMVSVESGADYRNMMRRLYQSEFVEKTQLIETAYEKKQAQCRQRLLKCNLLLECYDVKGYVEELRHRFTYENLEKELSGNDIVSLR